jgi:hypothetical protein
MLHKTLGVRVTWSLVVLCNVLYIIVYIFIPFILAIALSVLLRLTASDYPSSFYHEQSNTTEFSIKAFTTSFSPCILISFCCKIRLSQANSIPRTMHYIIFHLSPFLVCFVDRCLSFFLSAIVLSFVLRLWPLITPLVSLVYLLQNKLFDYDCTWWRH